MNESKALALSVVVAIAGAVILVVATSGVVEVPQRQLPAGGSSDVRSEEPPTPAGPSLTADVPAVSTPAPAAVPDPPILPTPAPAVAASEASLASAPSTSDQAPVGVRRSSAPTLHVPDADEAVVDRSGNFHPFPVPGGIREVDFTTGFSYPVGGVGPVIVDESHGRVGEAGADDYASVSVEDVIYGDLTGDGVDEAAIAIRVRTRTWDPYIQVWIFTVQDGLLQRLGTTSGGYLDASLRSLTIADGVVRVESWNVPADAVGTTSWLVAGRGLVRVEESARRRWVDVRAGEVGGLHPVSVFGSGVHRVTVAADRSDPVQTLSFETEGPWMSRLTPETGRGAVVRIWESSGRLIGDLSADAPVQLPGAGAYLAEVRFATDATDEVFFELDIADQRTLLAPTWQPRASASFEHLPAFRETIVTWPEFEVNADMAEPDAVNVLIADFVSEREQAYGAVEADCAENEDASLSVRYRPTLVSYDLIAVEFDEFISRCGYQVQGHTLIVDLNTGQRLGIDQILAIHSPALQQLWVDTLTAQNHWVPDGFEGWSSGTEFTSAELRPYGVALTARISDVPDGPVEISPMLTFEQLGALARPGIALRAASGAHAPYSVEESCGC